LIGRPIELLMPERFRGHHGGHRDRYFHGPTLRPMGTGMSLVGLRKNGEEFPIDVQLSPLKTTDGNFVLAAVIDHSETKRLERSLRDQLENRDQFLAMLSHELRNPLGAVLNAATIVDRVAAPDEPMREFIGLIVGQARQMSRLLDDLLDVSRVSQGKVRLRKEVLDLRDAIREAASATEYLVNGRRQSLKIQLPERPCNIDADRSRMIQVLENLFTNASKYTPDSGSIDVSLQVAPGHSTLFVRDNGRGIAQDKLETIFDMFAQCESSIDRREAGMGVGLTLVKSIVEMHGGTVTARSAGLGQGSEFVVVMPTTETPSPPADERSAALPSRSLRIVLVEDNDESRRTLATLLELDGYAVQTASDGRQGLELIQAEMPDAAILDIGLPCINGYELASRLRETFPANRLHLIALTGYGRAEDRAAVYEAGFNDHLVKPVQIDMLLASLARADGSLSLRQDTAGDG